MNCHHLQIARTGTTAYARSCFLSLSHSRVLSGFPGSPHRGGMARRRPPGGCGEQFAAHSDHVKVSEESAGDETCLTPSTHTFPKVPYARTSALSPTWPVSSHSLKPPPVMITGTQWKSRSKRCPRHCLTGLRTGQEGLTPSLILLTRLETFLYPLSGHM